MSKKIEQELAEAMELMEQAKRDGLANIVSLQFLLGEAIDLQFEISESYENKPWLEGSKNSVHKKYQKLFEDYLDRQREVRMYDKMVNDCIAKLGGMA